MVMRAVDGEVGKTDGQKKNQMEKVGSDGLARVRKGLFHTQGIQ